MLINIVTCTDWNYRRWATTLIRSLHDQYQHRYVIAVGEGDWQAWGAQLGVTIVPQPFNHAMDPVRWCQNVRMRHLRSLLEHCDYLLQVDSDVRQNRFTDFNRFQNADIFAVTKQYKTKRGEIITVDDRFRINAGWVLYKNTQYNRNRLQKIQQEFDHKYQDENGWDQIKLWQHYGRHVGDVNASDGKYIDDGSWGSFKADSTWYHCKGPGRKEKTDIDTWHNLDMTPQLT
jgi:hypothetical protein